MPGPIPHRDQEWTLSALAAVVGSLCARLPAVGDERVSAAPDERTLRYYQSTGVIDRPLRYDGRSAIYGYRHLLQALATRALQAQGYSLAQVQTALAGQSTAALEAAVAPAFHGPEPRLAVEPAPAHDAPSPVEAVPAARALVAYQLAPGVIVSVDPSQVADPAALVAQLSSALSSNPPNRSQP